VSPNLDVMVVGISGVYAGLTLSTIDVITIPAQPQPLPYLGLAFVHNQIDYRLYLQCVQFRIIPAEEPIVEGNLRAVAV
jgi:hypothetical protein